jgi:HEAT repeat protein
LRFKLRDLPWNIPRRKAMGEHFLQMAGVVAVASAQELWNDPLAPVSRRCLAARAIGLLGEHEDAFGLLAEDDDSPLASARWHAMLDAQRRNFAEHDSRVREQADKNMEVLGIESDAEAIPIVRDRGESVERRVAAADVLRGYRSKDAVDVLVEALAEGDGKLSGSCMSALERIGSKRGSRRLMEVARGDYTLRAKQEAVYTLWRLGERRAETLFIQIAAAVDREDWYTRDIATEALGNTRHRRKTQQALAERLFDPCVSVRYSALCAVGWVSLDLPQFLLDALRAKLADPDKVDDDRVMAKFAAEILARMEK